MLDMSNLPATWRAQGTYEKSVNLTNTAILYVILTEMGLFNTSRFSE
jgi:hypothetical protein